MTLNKISIIDVSQIVSYRMVGVRGLCTRSNDQSQKFESSHTTVPKSFVLPDTVVTRPKSLKSEKVSQDLVNNHHTSYRTQYVLYK